MPAGVNLRELACLTKYGRHEWYANRFTCVRCGIDYSTLAVNYVQPVIDVLIAQDLNKARHGR